MKNPVLGNNEFVRKEQEKQRKMMGDRPGAPAEMRKFNAYMSNDGEDAQKYARSIGLEDAFPVK